jgi:hypothetical protein
MCRVVEIILRRAYAGDEPWGTPHALPPVADPDRVHAIRNRLFAAKNCGQLEDIFGARHSISVMYQRADGRLGNRAAPGSGGYVLVIRAWPLIFGRREITERVRRGEQLAFNPMNGYALCTARTADIT